MAVRFRDEIREIVPYYYSGSAPGLFLFAPFTSVTSACRASSSLLRKASIARAVALIECYVGLLDIRHRIRSIRRALLRLTLETKRSSRELFLDRMCVFRKRLYRDKQTGRQEQWYGIIYVCWLSTLLLLFPAANSRLFFAAVARCIRDNFKHFYLIFWKSYKKKNKNKKYIKRKIWKKKYICFDIIIILSFLQLRENVQLRVGYPICIR